MTRAAAFLYHLPMTTFQKTIEALTTFWADQGCVIHTGCDAEVGAGTFNPATFLRSLGPEPYSSAYVEPSKRPQDGRYGENPNRLQLFHQFQVLIKPAPLDIQKLYLQSLEAMGIDLEKHDIRFVHDDWESPTLGASGLGWEVWCDGMEVTQFTYFQIVAGQTLDPISVEITYGLERLSMLAQGKSDFFSMQYNDHLTYGDVFHHSEVEWSQYNFEKASTSMWKAHFEDFEKESAHLIEHNLPLPAYDCTIKASHAFNMLEARGMLSVTERASYIAKVRHLAKECGKAYIEKREQLGFPLLKEEHKTPEACSPSLPEPLIKSEGTEDFLLEIGSEELPAIFVPIGMKNLKTALETLLKKEGIEYTSLQIEGTPRRLTAFIKDLSLGRKGQLIEKKGPPAAMCFDETGTPTKQGQGFFASQNLPPKKRDELSSTSSPVAIKTLGKQDYLVATVQEADTITAEKLAHHLPTLITSLPFPKKMRWGAEHLSYARPLEWIVSLFGSHTLPFAVGPYLSGNQSFGHKQRDNVAVTITSPATYFDTLKEHFVVVQVEERRAAITKQLNEIEAKLGATALKKEVVMREVLYLSEMPLLGVGDFSSDFLSLPPEVATSEMINHQRYFPLAESENGALLPHFVFTADKPPQTVIKEGNEKVLSARLRDGVFLYNGDLKTPLGKMVEKLANVTFHEKLGSMKDKIERMQTLAAHLAAPFGLMDESQIEQAIRLCKADLVSEMVGEFPHLQGVMGKYYALQEHLDESVAKAIEEHYCPKAEREPLPTSKLGALVSAVDRLDNLMAHFSIGLKPSSSSDPYALRRHAIALIKILTSFHVPLKLDTFFEATKALYAKDVRDELITFIYDRLKGVLKDEGFASDEIEAAFTSACYNLITDVAKVKALHAFRKTDAFGKLFEVFKRAKGQLQGVKPSTIDESLLKEPAEKGLMQALTKVETLLQEGLETGDFEAVFERLATLQPPLATFYEELKVLDDDEAIKNNRLALLQKVFSYFDSVLSFDKIQKG